MTVGAGKYDDVCTDVRERHHADGVVVIVLGGDRGSGFSMQGTPAAMMVFPDALRDAAELTLQDVRRMFSQPQDH